jgi:hypothetical protein
VGGQKIREERGLIGIKQLAANQFMKVAAETRFSGRDTAGDADNEAGFSHQMVAACSQAADARQLLYAKKEHATDLHRLSLSQGPQGKRNDSCTLVIKKLTKTDFKALHPIWRVCSLSAS